MITEKRKGELKINLDLLLTNYKLLPTGKSDPSKKMLQHNQLENCGEQVFLIENLLFLESMLLKKIGKQVPFRKCLPPGVFEERNMKKTKGCSSCRIAQVASHKLNVGCFCGETLVVTIKKVPEKAQKWPKMARFWPKWRYNGRAMARETFFYQCLWVTKFCAKFGRSQIPRTARDPNSFIVLRCM